ncbi:hypothetical protein niasHS_016782 [Heterodera schachtii]|uniref:Uncharacterized protein n=1 Tax=Heterodera schachtii TaxID=97005 RepID=A0ABD2HPN1_HETSC
MSRTPLNDITNHRSPGQNQGNAARTRSTMGRENIDPNIPIEGHNLPLFEEEIPLENPWNWRNLPESDSDSVTEIAREFSPMSLDSDPEWTWNPPRSIWPRNGREPLSQWFPRVMGNHWHERERRSAEALLRDFLRNSAFLTTNHLATNREIIFDGLSRSGAERTNIYPGFTVLNHFEGRGITINPLVPLVQECGGFSPRRGEIHMDYFPTEVVDLCYFERETEIPQQINQRLRQDDTDPGGNRNLREFSEPPVARDRESDRSNTDQDWTEPQETPNSQNSDFGPSQIERSGSLSSIPTIYIIFSLFFIENVMSITDTLECPLNHIINKQMLPVFLRDDSVNHLMLTGTASELLPQSGVGSNRTVFKEKNEKGEITSPLFPKMTKSSSSSTEGELSDASFSPNDKIPLCQRGIKGNPLELVDAARAVSNTTRRKGKDLRSLIDSEAKEVARKPPTCSDCGQEGHRRGAKKCPSPKEDRVESRPPAISPKIKETQPKKAESRGRLPIRGPVPIAPRKPSPPSPKVKATTESSLRRRQHPDLSGMACPDLSGLARISTDVRPGTSGYGGLARISTNERPGNSGYGHRPASAVESELIEAVRGLQSVVDELRKSIPPKLTGGNLEPLGRRKKRRRHVSSSSSSSSSDSEVEKRKKKKKNKK